MARISNKELRQAIIRQTGTKNQPVEVEQPDQVYYTIFGKHYALDENGNPLSRNEKGAYAKQELHGRTYYYFIKTGNSGHLLNPISGLYNDEEKKFSSTKGKMYFRFQKVSKIVFDYYISFLRTKNAAWLRHAEREN